jgi:hypothetical protein
MLSAIVAEEFANRLIKPGKNKRNLSERKKSVERSSF